MKRYNRSRQRERILDFVKRSRRHPSAEHVYRAIRKDFPKISLGTVYRNLAILGEQGALRKLGFAGDADRFDGCTEEHYHFVCNRCGGIYDLTVSLDDTLPDRVMKETGHRVVWHQVEFFGVCRRCATDKKE